MQSKIMYNFNAIRCTLDFVNGEKAREKAEAEARARARAKR